MCEQDKIDKLSCEIATLIYDKYLMDSYGINSCNINYTEGDIIEKQIRRSIMAFGIDCKTIFPSRNKEELKIDPIIIMDKNLSFPIPPPPNVSNPIQSATIKTPLSNVAYQYIQTFPIAVWIIYHNLNFTPNITTVDLGGNVIIGSVKYLNQSSNGGTIQITFSVPIAGKAYLS